MTGVSSSFSNLCTDYMQVDVTGMNMDLVLLAMMSKGNDYLPGVGCSCAGGANSLGFWKRYLSLKQTPRWAYQ